MAQKPDEFIKFGMMDRQNTISISGDWSHGWPQNLIDLKSLELWMAPKTYKSHPGNSDLPYLCYYALGWMDGAW
jgi:hypothetical protein